jgi:cytochrome c
MLLAVAVSMLAISGPALAGDGAKLFAEKTCTACHGAKGNKPLMPDYPKIAGQNEAYIVKQMTDIKSGARANGNSAAMNGVMVLVSDQDIKDIAAYVSKLKP